MSLVVSSLGGDAVLLAPAGLESGIIPVVADQEPAAGINRSIGYELVIIDVADVFLVVDVLLGIEDLGLLAKGLHREAAVVRDVGRAVVGGSRLGGDEYDTVTCLGSVDGCRGGVLQDLHRLDHGRIQVPDVVHLQTVHDEERSDGSGVRGITADADAGRLSRCAGGVDDLDTCCLSLKGGCGVGG